MRLVTGAPLTLTATCVDGTGEPAAPTGAVTVTVTSIDGTVIATAAPATVNGPECSVALAAAAAPDVWAAVWSDTTGVRIATRHEVVRRRLFTVADAKVREPVLRDAGRFPDAVLADIRDEVEDECEALTGVAWSGRYTVEQVFPTDDTATLRHVEPSKVRTITVDGTAETPAAVAEVELRPWGGLVRPGGWPPGVVVVGYEHGPADIPADLVRAALLRFKDRAVAVSSAVPDRATSYSMDGSVFRLSIARSDRTGIPDVDAVYQRYRRVPAGVA